MPGSQLKRAPLERDVADKRRAVVVDNDPDHCALLLLSLSQRGYAVTFAHSLREALCVAMRAPVQLAILRRDSGGDGGRAGPLFKSVSPATLVVETADNVAPCAPAEPETWSLLPRPVTYDRLERLLDAAAATAGEADHAGSSGSPSLSPKAAAAEPPLTAISKRPQEFS